MSNALTTKERMKSRLTINSTDFDTLFNNLIVSVTKRIEQMCNRQFTLATYIHELHDGSDLFGGSRSVIVTTNAPIGNIAAVSYKTGLNSNPTWVDFTVDDYELDADLGVLYFNDCLPSGKRNIRITYTAGWDGFGVGLTSYWNFNVEPEGDVDGSNGTFTLPEDADELIVYADGIRLQSSNVTFTPGTDTFTIAAVAVPFSTIAVDYKETLASSTGDPVLPEDLVDVAERAVAYLFKNRDNEGRTTESFGESSVTWRQQIFTPEMLATIKNYRRGDYL